MRHVYLHIPFCRRRCSYCDFQIAVRREVPVGAFVRDLIGERDLRNLRSTDPLATLYLGGGTPSLLPPDALGEIIRAFPCVGSTEVTLEANPEDVDPGVAAAWVAAGVNRVSLGVQTFDPAVLKWMHRPHGPDAPAGAMAALRAAGLTNVSVDLIFGVPASLMRDLRADLDHVLSLEPEHVSAYGLTVEDRTPFGRWVRDGSVTAAGEVDYEAEFLATRAVLLGAGFEHYEVSNYARPGARSRHNSAYWSGAAYAGLGPGAHSFDGTSRRWNIGPFVAWGRAVRAGNDPVEGSETPVGDAALLERVYLGLRTVEGIRADLPGLEPRAVGLATGQGWLVERGGRLQPTATGWLRLDALVPRLTTSGEGG